MGLASTYAALNRAAIDPAAIRAFTAEPWAISDAGRRQVAAVAIQAIQSRDAMPLHGTRQATVRGSVAVIPVSGPLMQRPSFFSGWFGGCDYETILKDLTAALESDDVKAIVFDVDSPGGLVAGVHDLATAIRSARGKKPIKAFIGSTGASAAYWIASACGEVIASPTALVGSIGCFASLVDDSELMAKIGIERHDVANKQSPFKVLDPASKDDRARVETWVTDQASVFIADVAAGRGRTVADVEAQFGRGDLLVGAAALKAGLVDAIGDLESVIGRVAAEVEQAKAQSAQKPSAVTASAPRATKAQRALSIKAGKAVKQGSTARAVTPRANKETAMADIEKLRDIAAALHGAAQEDHEDGKACAVALAPHMKAMHAEMGEDSPFSDDDGDESGAKALIAELGGSPKAAAGALAALKAQSKEFGSLKQRVDAAEARANKAELKALLDEAMIDGRIAKAQRADLEAKAKTHGIEFVRSFVEIMPPKGNAAVVPANEAAAQDHAKKSIASATAAGTSPAITVVEMSPVERKFAEKAVAAGRVKSIEEYAALRDQANAERMAAAVKTEEA